MIHVGLELIITGFWDCISVHKTVITLSIIFYDIKLYSVFLPNLYHDNGKLKAIKSAVDQ